MSDERLDRVVARLRAAPDLATAVRQAVSEGDVPAAAAAAISPAGLESLTADQQPLERVVPRSALEAIVQRVGRPPLLVRDGAVVLAPLVDFPAGTDALIQGTEARIASVGRVEFLDHQMSWGGTGWVVAEDGPARVVVTNRHVAQVVARRTADGRGLLLRSPVTGVRYGIEVDFGEEVGARPADARPVRVTEVLHLADDAGPDVAMLRIVGADLPAALPLADHEAVAGDLVALIGYPAFDSRNDAGDQARYFDDLYEVKRFAPGRVLQALSGRTVLTHDCTSLGGNSGSPLLRLEDGRVVGLHFAGVYGVANSAVGVRTLRSLLTSVTGAGARTPPGPVPGPVDGAGGEEARDGVHDGADLLDRSGYDPDFLGTGLPAPWPGLPAAVVADLARPTDEVPGRPGEVRYTHFGVRFSVSRRQPVMTAVNIDGAAAVRVKRGRDRWFADARVPLSAQLCGADYADPEIDRGHLVRREDPNWDPAATPGTVSALVRQADTDTFHYTNAAPQHGTMNQGRQLWLGLEEHVLGSARTHGFRACVFTGPVVREDDPEIGERVRAPREFWKLVAMAGADRSVLHATAYLLSQGDLIRDLLEQRGRTEAVEGFVLGPYRTFQLAVRDLADATGYDFSAYVAADPLSRPERGDGEAAGDHLPRFLPLETLADVVG